MTRITLSDVFAALANIFCGAPLSSAATDPHHSIVPFGCRKGAVARFASEVIEYVAMSAIGTKRTSLVAPHMSANDPKRTLGNDGTPYSMVSMSLPSGTKVL